MSIYQIQLEVFYDSAPQVEGRATFIHRTRERRTLLVDATNAEMANADAMRMAAETANRPGMTMLGVFWKGAEQLGFPLELTGAHAELRGLRSVAYSEPKLVHKVFVESDATKELKKRRDFYRDRTLRLAELVDKLERQLKAEKKMATLFAAKRKAKK